MTGSGGNWARGISIAGLTLLMSVGSAYGQVRCGSVGPMSIHACLHESTLERGEVPTIVLAAGAGQDSRSWRPVIDALSALGTVVTFDRPGLGQSRAVDGDRTPTAIARELRDVLEALGLPGPVFLVGHSMGGVHALRFGDLFPDAVAGVVLLDVPPPDFERARLELLTPDERAERRAALAEGRARAPAVVGRERDGAEGEAWTFEHFPDSVPLLVAVADSQYFGDLGGQEEHRRLWMRSSEQWLGLSSRSELVVAAGSGHMVHHERPELVIDLVRRLVEGGRR